MRTWALMLLELHNVLLCVPRATDLGCSLWSPGLDTLVLRSESGFRVDQGISAKSIRVCIGEEPGKGWEGRREDRGGVAAGRQEEEKV